ncbi:MAG: peptidoglycan-binding domain-containing protein [Candidatus Gracilibacteria bacterium]|nr:peptidoglycan-binding domain-containing protein [Candidatus Gracilibacteria bacterium]
MGETPKINPGIESVKSVSDLLTDITKDNRLDGNDLEQLNLLESQYEKEKNSISVETKQELKKAIESMLKDGYSIKNENDYKALGNILKILGDYKLASYNDVYSKIPENNRNIFSFVLDGDKLLMYVKEGYMNKITVNTDEFGYIDLKTGTFSQDTNISEFFLSFDDDISNNNQFKFKYVNESPAAAPATTPTAAPATTPTAAPASTPEVKKSSIDKAKDFYEKVKANKNDIIKVQKSLNMNNTDGKFDNDTFKSIIEYQKNNQLATDGQVGTKTLQKMKLINGTQTYKDFYGKNETIVVENEVADTVAPAENVTTLQPDSSETTSFNKEQLSKGVNITSEIGYNEFIKSTKLEGQPTYDELKNQIEKYDSSKSLSMSFEDGRINVYYGDIRENNRANPDSYPINNEDVQKYVMKYGEIVNGKLEKSGVFERNMKFDDLGNNS